MTIAEVYGLKENPFEPTGAAVGKYPFVPPANFPILEQKIQEAGTEKKLYALLVNSPHGAGKSTTMEYLKQKAMNGGYLSFRAPVILTKLENLSIRDFVEDILREARAYRKTRPLSKSPYTTTRLRTILVDTLTPIAKQSKLMLWIIDEFDILADRPQEQQQSFLQFLRGVIDDLASRYVSIAFIMSHTKYSSREFERHLSQQHGPFQSRLVASLPLAYTFDEVKNIVAQRLKSARDPSELTDDLHPFSEQSLRTLYNLIISIRGSDCLDNFRVFERICHFALIEGAKTNQIEIDTSLIQKLFQEYGLKESSFYDQRLVSITATQGLADIKSTSLMEINESIFQGIQKGIINSTFFRGTSIANTHSSYIKHLDAYDMSISSLSFTLHKDKRAVNISWLLVSNTSEIIQKKDLEELLQILPYQLEETETYFHLKLFSYVSRFEVVNIPQSSFNRFIWLSPSLSEDLMGLTVGTPEDIKFFMKSFDSEIAPILNQLVSTETRDITTSLSQRAIELIYTLNIMSAIGQSCTTEAIRSFHKRLFMRRSKVQERYAKEIVMSGFAKEETGQIKPSMPRSHRFLLHLLEDKTFEGQSLIQKLGSAGEAIIETALTFHLIKKEQGTILRRRLAEYEDNMAYQIRDLQQLNKDSITKQMEPGKWITWLLTAYDKVTITYHKHIILSAIEILIPSIKKEISKSSRLPTPTSIVSEKQKLVSEIQEKKPTVEMLEVHKNVVEPVIEKGPIEDAILETIKNTGPMTLTEIDTEMRQRGYGTDIRGAVFRLVFSGKLKFAVTK